MTSIRTEIRQLTLPYEALETVYSGDSEVRLYRNELTGQPQVGKRYDALGLEATVAFREAELLQRISHPNLATVQDIVEVSGYPPPMQVIELIMPWYQRGSICDALVRGERFSVGEAISLMSGGLLGVAELHECESVLHRDLKSPNFFLADDGRLLVGDLGTAIPMEGDGTAEALPAPRLYSPPEALAAGRVDRRSEIYQCGLALHELASGPFPYEDSSLTAEGVAQRLADGRPGPRPRHLRHGPWVPPRLRRLINTAVRSDPDRRYPTAERMGRALGRVPYVDWRVVADDPTRKRWEGAAAQRPDRQFAVEAILRLATSRRPDSKWVLSGYQRLNRWQRVVPDAILEDGLDSSQATQLFDQMVAIATSR